jgi:hypothetical protein
MLAWILSALGLGGLGALTYLVGPAAMLGFARSIFGFLAKIPWQAYAIAALVGVLAFLVISRGHAIDRYKGDETRLELVCKAVRDVAGRPRQNCELNALQIRAFGKSITDLEGALREQDSRIQELGRKNAELQAEAKAAEKLAAKRANQAESVAQRLDESAKHAPAQPCAVSKALEEQWR